MKQKTIKEALQEYHEKKIQFSEFLKEIGDRQARSIEKVYAELGDTKC